jgi:hypothetical protein
MSTNHPGNWYVAQVLNQRTLESRWYVARPIGADRERLMDGSGRVRWFASEAEARAAIRAATPE